MKKPRTSQRFLARQNAAGFPSPNRGEPVALADWIRLIHEAWACGANRALELGRLMSRARESLPHGGWSQLWQSGRLPFSKRKGEMLVVIGEGLGGVNTQNSAQLPPAWNTLYYLARLGQTLVEQLIRQGRIYPDLSLREARALLAEFRPGAQRKTPRSKLANRLARWTAFVHAEMGNWSLVEREWVCEQLLALTGEIQQLESPNGSQIHWGPSLPHQLVQFADEHLVSPAVPDLISQASQRHPIPIPVL